MSRRTWFILAVALQLLVLTAMIGMRTYTLQTGVLVRLKTIPVDPRDLFRGDYVILRYEISSLEVPAGEKYRRGETVYVVLKPGEAPFWTATGVARGYPVLGAGEVAMKGRVQWHNDWDNRLEVRYGIEQFFVPEGEGRRLEEEYQHLDAEVAVDRFGNAGLKRLFLKGEEIRFR